MHPLKEYFRGKPAAVLATAGVLAVCGACLLLPGLWGARQEAALLQGPVTRPAVAGLPDEEARAIPILYDLYRTRLQPGNFGWQEGDAGLLPELEECLDRLADSGVLPRELPDQVRPLLEAAEGGEEVICLSQRTGNFAGVQISAGSDRRGCRSLSAVWDTRTGGVVSLLLSGARSDADPAALLAAWRQDLGLDALGDWQEETAGAGVSAWSDKAQVYLYCGWEGSDLRMTMTNLSGLERG